MPVVKLPRVSEYLKAEGLIDSCEIDDMEPVDVTKNVLEFPADRSARLQTLTRADGGFIGDWRIVRSVVMVPYIQL